MSSDLKKKLEQYRAQRGQIDCDERLFALISSKDDKESRESLLTSKEEEENDVCTDNLSDIEEDGKRLFNCTYLEIMYYGLCFILWATVYGVFIKLQFGTVYLIISGLVGIYVNTRTGPKKLNEVSAYSVFNKDCKSIDGTLKAEQFEREIRYGPATLR